MRRTTALSTPIAHLVGPGKVKVVNSQLAFSAPGQGPFRLDPRALRTLYCYGPVGITDEAVQVLWQHNVQVAWLTPAGTRCRGRLVQDDPSATPVRLLQHRLLTLPVHQLELARWLVGEKLRSQIQAVRHYQRHGCREAGATLERLHQALAQVATVAGIDQVRGLEGHGTAVWFSLFGSLLRSPWQFPGRVRRPPTDPVNALLSLAATWLLSRAVARCQARGLELYLGALHAYRPGRPSLACDLIEPLRALAVERWVLSVCNEGLIRPEEFAAADDRGVRLQNGLMPRMILQWEEHWVNTGPEKSLDDLLEAFIARLRRQGSSLPPLPGEEAETCLK